MLVLDAGTLAHRESETYRLRYGDVDSIVTNLQNLTATLTGYASDPSALVFVQSIGRLAEWDAYEGRGDLPYWWQRAGGALQALGGHAMLWDALTDDTYTQVGPALFGDEHGYPAPFTSVVSPKVTNTPGQLSGLLSRTANWQFAVSTARPPRATSPATCRCSPTRRRPPGRCATRPATVPRSRAWRRA